MSGIDGARELAALLRLLADMLEELAGPETPLRRSERLHMRAKLETLKAHLLHERD